MKKLLLFTFLLAMAFTGYSQSVSLPSAQINPAPLDTVEENGVGIGEFTFAESSGLDVPAMAFAMSNVTISVNFQYVELTDGDVSGITGNILDYFTASYDAGSNILTFSQSAVIPGDWFGSVAFPVTVIQNSSQEESFNGFNANIAAIDANTNAEGNAAIFTYTADNSLSVIKSQTNATGLLGDIITYDIVVTNDGNTTLTDIEVTDDNAVITGGNPIASLVPGASATVTAEHEITQADVDLGYVDNTAIALGDSPTGTDNVSDVSDTGTDTTGGLIIDPETIETPSGDGTINDDPTDDPTVSVIEAMDAISILKTGMFNDENGDGFAQVGETISYTFTVTNTGDTSLTGITVTDPLVTVVGGPIDLAPGAVDSTTFTAVYTMTQADIDAGGGREPSGCYGSESKW